MNQKLFLIFSLTIVIILSGSINAVLPIGKTANATTQKPNLVIEKKIDANALVQNVSFTVEVLFHNAGNIPALNISLKDNLPAGVVLDSGDISWSGQLKPGEGNGFVYTAIATKKGYTNFGSAKATYRDAKGANYTSSSNTVEFYVAPSAPPTFFDFLDKYQKPLQIIGAMGGAIGAIYGLFEIIKKMKKPVQSPDK